MTLGQWADIASLVGLGLTVFTLIAVQKIRRSVLFRTEVDNFSQKLVEKSSEIANLLQQYDKNRHDLLEIFVLLDVELRAMERGASGDVLGDVKNARRSISRYRSRIPFWKMADESGARSIKLSVSIVAAELVHERKQMIAGG